MAEVIFSSSYDEKHDPNNIFTSNKKQFFASTGMFPQEICVQFSSEKNIKSVSICSYGIKRVQIQTCENEAAMQFETQAEQSELPGGKMQNISLNLQKCPRVKVMKIIVLEGYEDFFTIHSLTI